MQQGEHVVSIFPRVVPIAALAFGLMKSKIWPALMCPLHRSLTSPLIPYSRYKGPSVGIFQNRMCPGIIIRMFDSAGPDLAGNTCLAKARSKVVTNEVAHFRPCPDTG